MNHSTLFINLDSLVELSNKLNSSRNIEFILNSVILSLMGKLGYFRGGAFAVGKSLNNLQPIVVKGKIHKNLINGFVKKVSYLIPFDKAFHLSLSNKTLKVALQTTDKRIFILIFVSRFKKKELSPEERHYLSLVLNMTSNALEIATSYENLYKTNFELQKRNQLLTTILEINKDHSIYLSKEEITNQIKFRIFGQLIVTKFAIFYEELGKIDKLLNTLSVKIPNKIIEYCLSLSDLLDVNKNKKSIPKEHLDFLLKNEIQFILPLVYHNQTRGAILFGKKFIDIPYTEEDMDFMKALGSSVAIAFENCRLLSEELKRKQYEMELQLALEIQKNLLPKEIPSLEKVEVWGFSKPSRFVGGDYFDIILPNESTLFFAIADVSGKGIPASLLMANVQSALRALVRLDLSLYEMVNHINSVIFQNTTSDKFITFFLGKLDLRSFKLQYINAGHNPPIFLSNSTKEVKFLSKGGYFLGFMNSPIDYEIGEECLQPNDFVLLYTDGVTECTNYKGREFGMRRLEEFVRENSNLDVKSFCDLLHKTIMNYCRRKDLGDDLSIVALKVK